MCDYIFTQMETIQGTLKKFFGYDQFRLKQEEIINNVLSGSDTFVLMPTGGGKSLCYQLPALRFSGITVVVSPLIALMKDQVDALKANGIKAAVLNSTLSNQEQQQIIYDLKNGNYKILYLSPERLFTASNPFINILKELNVSLFAVDEAHCISHWGHDFRAEYLQLGQLKNHFPKVPVVALTASADGITQKDIISKLNLNNPNIYISSFNRPNIHYYIEPKRKYKTSLINYLKKHKDDSGIIYCLSRKSTEELSEELNQEGFNTLAYHAGMDSKQRSITQEKFQKDEIKIIVATIAFGMGIDKSNVRFVIHADLPKNIESYYQETGRAGRDGLQSDAILYYTYADAIKLKSFVEVDNNQAQSAIMLAKLEQMVGFCEEETCRRQYLLNYFGEQSDDYCGTCDFCLSGVEEFDGTLLAQKALSAVSRLGERYGANFVIDFLRGSKGEKINQTMRELKTYGIGNDVSTDDWKQYFKYLLRQGFLHKEDEQYGVLKLNAKSWELLKGNSKIKFRKLKNRREAEKESVIYDATLLQLLKSLRQEFALKENVPAYIVFSDNTLVELATYFPQTETEITQISGMGEFKVKKYGAAFLNCLKEYCSKNNIVSKVQNKEAKKQKMRNKPMRGDTQLESYNLYRQGNTIEKIAELRKLARITIEGHLSAFVSKGELSPFEFITQEKYDYLKGEALKYMPILLAQFKEIVGETYSYGEIKMVLAHMEYTEELKYENYRVKN